MGAPYKESDAGVVVVIGSGPGGATVGHELARQGVDVVCLEAGGRVEFTEFENDFWSMLGKVTWLDQRTASGQLNKDFPAYVCKTVGGSSVHWAGAALRFLPHEFRALSSYSKIDGADLADWPLAYQEIEPFYSLAEERMGVTGTHGIPYLPENNNFKVLKYGAGKVGLKNVGPNNMAINSLPRDGRSGCIQMGFCMSGCRVAAKWSTLYTEVPKAEATGKFELRSGCMAVKINHDARGRATGVVYVDSSGVMREQKARVVCVAGNSIETPRLLLNSSSSAFPNGLANSSGYVGKTYMIHVTSLVYAVMPGPVHADRGTQMAGIVRDNQAHDPARGFAGGYQLQTIPGMGPRTLAGSVSAVIPGTWGTQLAGVMDKYANVAGLHVFGEDLPQMSNAVTLNSELKDKNGMPVAHLNYKYHQNDSAMFRHATELGKQIYEAAGSKEVYVGKPVPATHNMGTCRQSEKPSLGVCNKWGAAHDVPNLFVSDGSQFTSSASVNPTLTIVALAIRQAKHIKGLMASREL